MGRVLIVDDDEDILELLKYNLCKEGFEVQTLPSGENCIEVANTFKPDLIVLDLMMPEINGIEICKAFRSHSLFRNLYIFFLTAKSDDYYKHATYNIGADDFIEKIMGIKPLISKINAVLVNQFTIRKRAMKIEAGPLALFQGVQTVYKDGNKILLSKQEFEILFFFVQNPGRKINLDDIIKTLWGSETYMDVKNARSLIQTLRYKIGSYFIVEKNDYFRFKAT